MSRQIRCDGCGGWVDQPTVQGRRDPTLSGDAVPPSEFDWCQRCTVIAFDAVLAADRRRREHRLAAQDRAAVPYQHARPGYLAPVAVSGDETEILAGVPAGVPALRPSGLDSLLGWVRPRELRPVPDGDDATAILPRPYREGSLRRRRPR